MTPSAPPRKRRGRLPMSPAHMDTVLAWVEDQPDPVTACDVVAALGVSLESARRTLQHFKLAGCVEVCGIREGIESYHPDGRPRRVRRYLYRPVP